MGINLNDPRTLSDLLKLQNQIRADRVLAEFHLAQELKSGFGPIVGAAKARETMAKVDEKKEEQYKRWAGYTSPEQWAAQRQEEERRLNIMTGKEK